MTIDEVYKKKLYSIFHMRGHIHNGEWAIAPSEEGALLDDIAQAHEQDKADALKQLELRIESLLNPDSDGCIACHAHQEEVVKNLRASLAVMAEALRHIKDEWFDKWYPADIFVGGPDSDEGVNDVVAIREMIVQALQSAPTVAWTGEVKVRPSGIILYLANAPFARAWDMGHYNRDEGKVATAVVLVKQEDQK